MHAVLRAANNYLWNFAALDVRQAIATERRRAKKAMGTASGRALENQPV
jgi:hypothetical protein